MDLQALLLTALASLVLAVLLGPIFIPILRRLKFGQSIREEGPKHHQVKAGTPTMGGMIIVLALVLGCIRFAFSSIEVVILIFATVAFGLIGFADDYIKDVRKHNLGLKPRQKLVLQALAALALFGLVSWYWHSTEQGANVSIPFTHLVMNLGIFYLFFFVVILWGTTNAVNITDGLDGLLSGTAAVVFAAYAVYAYWHTEYDVALFCASMVGALMGFLVFNRHPAKVFMGDTGSLAIGGALALVAVLTHSELGLILFGLVFVIEMLSVIIQVFSFQTFGRRIFRMSPLHHHFELSGWTEWEVVVGFWLFAFLTAFGTLAVLSR